VDENFISKILGELGLIIGDDSDVRYQVINITIPNATGANQLVESAGLVLDPAYNKIIGIGYAEVSYANVQYNYNVGARSNRRTYLDDINIKMWAAESGVGPMFKYYRTNIHYGTGDTFYARVTPNILTNASFAGQMILVLKSSLTEKPK
jgi:hypothetical protein